jgi:hypothetical protein
MITKAYGAGEGIPHQILGQPWIAEPPAICTQSFLFVCTENYEQAKSVESYYRTRFLRFLVSLRKITQDTTRDTCIIVIDTSIGQVGMIVDSVKEVVDLQESQIEPSPPPQEEML